MNESMNELIAWGGEKTLSGLRTFWTHRTIMSPLKINFWTHMNSRPHLVQGVTADKSTLRWMLHG